MPSSLPSVFRSVIQRFRPLFLDSNIGLSQRRCSPCNTIIFIVVPENEVCIVKAVRGITVVELVDMNLAPKILLESRSESEQKKFGWFTCTGGNMRLFLTLERTAFVCGEGFSINGREIRSSINVAHFQEG